MSYALSLLAGLLPIVLICLFVYLRDRARPETPRHLALTFLLGAIFALPVAALEVWSAELPWAASTDWIPYTLYTFLGVALIEELAKYLAVLVYPFRQTFFDEPIDGMVYCVFAAMGFATVEVVVLAGHLTWQDTFSRVMVAVAAHAAFAMLAGYFLGRAREQRLRQQSTTIFTGLLCAFLAHGTYAWLMFNPYSDVLRFVGIGVLLFTWALALWLTRKQGYAAPSGNAGPA